MCASAELAVGCNAGCGLWAMILGARLCSLGADAIDAEPGLPAAKIV